MDASVLGRAPTEAIILLPFLLLGMATNAITPGKRRRARRAAERARYRAQARGRTARRR